MQDSYLSPFQPLALPLQHNQAQHNTYTYTTKPSTRDCKTYKEMTKRLSPFPPALLVLFAAPASAQQPSPLQSESSLEEVLQQQQQQVLHCLRLSPQLLLTQLAGQANHSWPLECCCAAFAAATAVQTCFLQSFLQRTRFLQGFLQPLVTTVATILLLPGPSQTHQMLLHLLGCCCFALQVLLSMLLPLPAVLSAAVAEHPAAAAADRLQD
jgi:hypothetical protein